MNGATLPATFHCPECGGLLEVAKVIVGAQAIGANGSERSGRRTAAPAGRAQKKFAQRAAEKQADQQWKDRALDRRVATKKGQVCPAHGVARPSRFGGLYCPQPDPASPTGWCTWRPNNAGEGGQP